MLLASHERRVGGGAMSGQHFKIAHHFVCQCFCEAGFRPNQTVRRQDLRKSLFVSTVFQDTFADAIHIKLVMSKAFVVYGRKKLIPELSAASRYGLYGPGVNPGGGRVFPHPPRPAHQLSCTMGAASLSQG